MMDQKFVYVVHNIKHLWVIIWHIFTSTNNTTTILFPTQLWELLYTYHVIKQCTEKETTSLILWPKGVLCYALHTQTFDPSFVHWRLGVYHHLQKYFSYYFCGGNWSTQRNLSWMTVLHCYIMWFHKSRGTKNTIHIRACFFSWGKAWGVPDDNYLCNRCVSPLKLLICVQQFP
jgi:hypothetical protein